MNKRTTTLLGVIILVVGIIWAASLIWPLISKMAMPDGIGQGIFVTKPVWTFETSEPLVASPVVDGTRVFLHTTRGIYALDSTDGRLLWKSESPGDSRFGAVPVAFKDILFVPEGESQLGAYAVSDGTKLWWDCPAAICTVQSPILSAAFANDTLFVTRYNWRLTAYGAKDGRIKWEAHMPDRDSAEVVASHNTVYVTPRKHLQAYDATSGELLWDQDIGSIIGKATLDGDTIYMVLYTDTGSSASLLAFDTVSHQPVWKVPLENQRFNSYDYVGAYGDSVFVGRDYLVAMAKNNGEIRWKSGKVAPLQRPVFFGNIVFIRTEISTLYGFDVTTGDIVGTLDLHNDAPEAFAGELNPAMANDLLIAPMGDWWVYAYQIPNTNP